MIPKNISREHILKAIEEIDRTGIPKGRDSKKFQLSYNGKYYPPKYVISLANKYANSRELGPSEFSGGQEVNIFLERSGFRVIGFLPKVVVRPSSDTRKIGERKGSRHDERCPECKKTIEIMLDKVYGNVRSNYRFEAGTKPEDYENHFIYPKLKEIFSKLENHRGHRDFVRSQTLPSCDFFIPSPGFIVEFDESQHFTACRKVALSEYAESMELGFDREKWIMLCEKIDAKDNDPPFRDEQRAWYDTLRDFLPTVKGLRPTVRIFSQDLRWCSLKPDNLSDVERFRMMMEGRRPEWKIKIKEDPNPSLARVIITGQWNPSVDFARELLEEICEKWPKGKKVGFLISCGGFIEFDWPGSIPDIWDNKNPNLLAVECLREEAEVCCRSLLDGLYEKLKEHADYLTIGIDSHKGKISLTKNYISEPHFELVFLVDLRTKKHYWTGKSYPTPNQVKGLVRICNLGTHFVDSDYGKVMILGCHDLTLFNPRSKNARGWRERVNKAFRDLAKEEQPAIVLQHPHTTDSVRTWAAAWSELRRILPTVREYASAGRYYNPDGERSRLDDVLIKTKCDNTIDFVCEVG